MTVLKQYKSEEFGGLEIVIDDNTGEVFASTRAIARLINKDPVYVRRFTATKEGQKMAETLANQGKRWDKVVEIVTPGGKQTTNVYNEDFIVKILAKYNPSLLAYFSKAGLRVTFHKLVGYSDTQAVTAAMNVWRSVRHELRLTHGGFQAACQLKGHSPKCVHDMITACITGWTAEEARKLGELVEGDDSIGLNHQLSPRNLELIRRAKIVYSGLRTGDWKTQVNKAVFQATED